MGLLKRRDKCFLNHRAAARNPECRCSTGPQQILYERVAARPAVASYDRFVETRQVLDQLNCTILDTDSVRITDVVDDQESNIPVGETGELHYVVVIHSIRHYVIDRYA